MISFKVDPFICDFLEDINRRVGGEVCGSLTGPCRWFSVFILYIITNENLYFERKLSILIEKH